MTKSVKEQAGHRGSKTVKSGTTAHTAAAHGGPWDVIQCITDCEFSTITDMVDDGESLAGVTIPAGTPITGMFVAVTRTSGTYRLHKSGSAD